MSNILVVINKYNSITCFKEWWGNKLTMQSYSFRFDSDWDQVERAVDESLEEIYQLCPDMLNILVEYNTVYLILKRKDLSKVIKINMIIYRKYRENTS